MTLKQLFFHLLVALTVVLVSVWASRRLSLSASRLRLLDHPNKRSLHAVPVPRTGGLAILLSFAVGLLVEAIFSLAGLTGPGVFTVSNVWMISTLFLIAIVSLLDDWRELSAAVRICAHFLAAAGAVFGAGLKVASVSLPLAGSYSLGWFALPLTILWLVWMINLYNFMDGMDGFAGGMSVFGLAFLGLLAWTGGAHFVASLALLAVAAVSGFLIFNWPPARIFMGDAGSTFLGFLVGVLSVWGIRDGLFDLWVPVLIFSPFIVDATITLLRRLLRGEKVWHAHREHYYQRVVLLGFSHRKTVFAEYGLMLACGSSAVIYQQAGPRLRLIALVAWAIIYLALALGIRVAEQRKSLRCSNLATEKI
jgi:UDP-N-acetylmuramyl pentapeptide phosphotransferase/UDP-N-acetylglucosamine-1-phosphate transferase